MANMKIETLKLKLIILIIVIAVFAISGFFTFYPMTPHSQGQGQGQGDTLLISKVLSLFALAELFITPLLLRFIVFPSIDKDTKSDEVAKFLIKKILVVGMLSNVPVLAMLAVWLTRMQTATLPAWMYLNYISILIFLAVAYKCWPQKQAVQSETFGGDLLECEN